MAAKRHKTLINVYRELAKQRKTTAEEVIPAVFSLHHGNWNVIETKAPDYGVAKGRVVIPLDGSKKALATRAQAYGHMLAEKNGMVPVGLGMVSGLDAGWIDSIRSAVGRNLMLEANVEEILERNPPQLGDTERIYHIAQWAMWSIGTIQQKAVITKAKKLIRRLGYKKQANILESMLTGAVECAKDYDDIATYIRELQDLYGTRNQEPNKIEAPPVVIPAAPEVPKEPFIPKHPEMGNLHWGKMKMVQFPMIADKDINKAGEKRWKRSPVGAFRYPWRALRTSDLQCFAVRRRTYGGTILLDLSGSMSVSENQVRTVMKASPHATIAAYAGETYAHEEGGKLGIVAKDGKMADCNLVRNTLGQENIIDGPALEWLSRQPEPRFWVSDGLATALDINNTLGVNPEIRQACQHIAKTGKIKQISSMAKMIKMLKGGKASEQK